MGSIEVVLKMGEPPLEARCVWMSTIWEVMIAVEGSGAGGGAGGAGSRGRGAGSRGRQCASVVGASSGRARVVEYMDK